MKGLLTKALACGLLLASSISWAVGPGSGSLTEYDKKIGSCHVDEITVKWNLDSLMGEPTVSGSYKWTGDSGCTLPSSTTIWLKVTASGGWSSYVRLSPVIPKSGGGWAYDTTGSPNWNNLMCGFQGSSKRDCFDVNDAKHIWKNGSVVSFEIGW